MLPLRPRRRDRRRPGRLGAWPATACVRCAGSPTPPRTSPAPRSSTRSRSRATTRSPGWRTAFNAMLAALSASRDRQRQLVADAGHELRTPLTSLRTNLDLLAQADRAARLSAGVARRAAGRRTRPDRGATTLIGDLVELARDEPATPRVEAVDLAEVVDGRSHRVRRRAPGLHVRRARRAVVGHRRRRRAASARSPTCSTTPPSGARRWARSRSGSSRACWSPTRGTASPRPTCRTSSTASTAPPSRARCPAPGSGSSIVRQVAERHGGDASRVGRGRPGRRRRVLARASAGTSHGHVPGRSQRRLSLARHARGHDGAEPEPRQRRRTTRRHPARSPATERRVPPTGTTPRPAPPLTGRDAVRRTRSSPRRRSPSRHRTVGGFGFADPPEQDAACSHRRSRPSGAVVAGAPGGGPDRRWHSAAWLAPLGSSRSTTWSEATPPRGRPRPGHRLAGRRPQGRRARGRTPSRRSPSRCCPRWSRSTSRASRARAPARASCSAPTARSSPTTTWSRWPATAARSP